MDDMTLLSTEAEGVSDSIPEEYKASHVNAAGRVGALLGLTELSTDVSEPDSVVPERVGPHHCLYSDYSDFYLSDSELCMSMVCSLGCVKACYRCSECTSFDYCWPRGLACATAALQKESVQRMWLRQVLAHAGGRHATNRRAARQHQAADATRAQADNGTRGRRA
jgi:hypothetical protein